MCYIWQYPTKYDEEFQPELLNKLPSLNFANITGGEPFKRDDIEEIVLNKNRLMSKDPTLFMFVTNQAGSYLEQMTRLDKSRPRMIISMNNAE